MPTTPARVVVKINVPKTTTGGRCEIETDTGEKLEENSFHLIVFEKNGKGKLFSGQGWIDLESVVKNPTWADLPKPWT